MPDRLPQALIGAGANLGDRAATLAAALERLRAAPGIAVLAASSIYETAPVGPVDQPNFLNLVAGVETTLTPEALLALLLDVEHAFGRVRSERWGPRTLDLDLLAFEGQTRRTADLQLPHPRMLERSFVLVPLAELLARPRFQRPAWDALRASAAACPPDPGVRRFR
ncbi:2-amino-4-hydroxy-6-hydroxymethyldihydropteridine diphosphokinase [Horticoccus luteus]|uniref:2-amino-4-hydroxy-6-hydroxymethyldihydropteridine pyrophosphokinase n=1 Tax=Horticoccus luteus TaxID=2862869 RepID=A0A8F9TVU5_9BACT|nr:2-amino-4-hydroxy-6-hydroxymethyldihydropteridine diphosphokinase [Horticoccus luteus]QYM78512.1 2-amino-4-hydroxy-6-hydroxymethyldihydropteridine diphosphokinase [Horticoccus luteus]